MEGDPFNLFGSFQALGNPLGSGVGMDWDFNDLEKDPLEKEAQELENKLLRQKIETERARGELVLAKKRQAASLADEASAKAETQRSFLPHWKKPK